MKKALAILLALGMALTVLAGCGTGGSSVAPAADGEGDTSPSATEAGEEPVDDGDAITIQIFHHIGEQTNRENFTNFLAVLNERSPGVVYEEQAIDYSQYETMLKTKLAGGDAPDIMMGRPKVYADLVRAGHVMSLEGLDVLEHVSETALDSMYVDGAPYSVPTTMGMMGTFYNKALFEDNNISIPKTHEQLMDVAAEFEALGIIPFAHGFAESWMAQADFQSDFYGYALAQNPMLYEEVENGASFADYPEFVTSTQRFIDRLSFEGGDDFGTDAVHARNMLVTGEAAMFVSGNWEIGEFVDMGAGDDIGFFTTPNNENGDPVLGIAPDGCWMIYSQTEYPEEALAFLEFYTSPEGAALMNSRGTDISCIIGAPTDNLSGLVREIMELAETGETYNYEAEAIFSGQRDSSFRKWQEEVAADQTRDLDELIERLDREFAAIQ